MYVRKLSGCRITVGPYLIVLFILDKLKQTCVSCVCLQAFHSSVLRVGTPGIHLWCHFDVMANVLMQFVGHKRVLLFPPSQDENLYITVCLLIFFM